MKIKSCPWILRRLPLLDGGELAGEERRQVERHLIGCTDCRDRRTSTAQALSVLHRFAEVPAAREAPSLWPVLERQIRQSRHVAARPVWSLSWLFARSSPALGFGLAVGGVMAVGFGLGRSAPVPVVAPSPVSTRPAVVGLPSLTDRVVKPIPSTRPALPETPARPVKLLTKVDDPFRPPNIRFDYVLDHGYPIGSGPRDPQRSY